jgi:tetratricopeptide (TPR) repeat protein
MPEDVEPSMLAPEIRAELSSLGKPLAATVARFLVMAGRLVDDDPDLALAYARQARRFGARIGVVREAAGITAYHAGEWAEALTDLRAARRLTGDAGQLPLIADAERALGRPERALRIAQSDEARQLGPVARAELRIVEAGARRDLGELDAALVILRAGGLDRARVLPWSARLWYAYADTLLAAGKPDEAADWFLAVASIDPEAETDAEDRLVELGVLEPIDDDENPATDTAPTLTPEPAEANQPADEPSHDENLPAAPTTEQAAPNTESTAAPPPPLTATALFQEPATDPQHPTIPPPPTDNSPA